MEFLYHVPFFCTAAGLVAEIQGYDHVVLFLTLIICNLIVFH
jgi:hypothetical protein